MKYYEYTVTIGKRKCKPRDFSHLNKKILNIGCGSKKTMGSIGLDIVKHPNVDVVHNLTKFPYPFKNNEFDIVIANHILEHIQEDKKFFGLIREIHRILKLNGIFSIEVPYKKGRFSCSILEHTRFFQIGCFDYLNKEEGKNQLLNKSGVYFDVVSQEFSWVTQLGFLNYILKPLYNLYHPFSEVILSNIISPDVVKFELRSVK